MKNSDEIFAGVVEDFLSKSGMYPTTFGVQVMNDRRFVFHLRQKKRSVTLKTRDRVMAYIDAHKNHAA